MTVQILPVPMFYFYIGRMLILWQILLNSIYFMQSTKLEFGMIATSLARRRLNKLAMAGQLVRMDALHRLCSSLLHCFS